MFNQQIIANVLRTKNSGAKMANVFLTHLFVMESVIVTQEMMRKIVVSFD